MEFLLNGLAKIFGQILTLGEERRKEKNTALMSIATALCQTNSYYSELLQGQQRNTTRENEIAIYWMAAAISIRHFDSELAEICVNKSSFFMNPEEFQPDERMAYRGRLDQIEKIYTSNIVRR